MRHTVLVLHVGLFSTLAMATPGTAFRFRDLVSTIQTENLSTMEAVLHRLPRRLRESFTLVKKSESLQGASPQHPRVILFGDDGRLLVAFNGHEKQGGYRKLEVIEATDAGPLEFREITFDLAGREAPKISDANPKRCTNCHGQQSGYLWSGYPHWPRVYGELDDQVEPDSPQGKDLDAFRKSAAKHPRYAALVFPNGEGDEQYPYYGKSAYRNLDRMPNTRLSKTILRNEARARIALSAQRDWYRQTRIAWAFEALECDPKNLSAAAAAQLASERSALSKAVSAPVKADGIAKAAHTLAMADTSHLDDYVPPDADGTDYWTHALDSAMLAEMSADFPQVGAVYRSAARRLEVHYRKDPKFAGNAFRPEALDAILLIMKGLYVDDDSDDDDVLGFFGNPFKLLPPGPAQTVDVELERRRTEVAQGCDELAEALESTD